MKETSVRVGDARFQEGLLAVEKPVPRPILQIDANGILHFRIIVDNGLGSHRCHPCNMMLISAPLQVQGEPVNPVCMGVIRIVTHFMLNIQENKKTTTYAHGQSGDINHRKERLFEQISHGHLEIILQHHEYNDGTGFPRGHKGSKILTLSNVVCLANDFVNLIVAEELSPTDGLKRILQTEEMIPRYHPKILENFIKVFVDPAKFERAVGDHKI